MTKFLKNMTDILPSYEEYLKDFDERTKKFIFTGTNSRDIEYPNKGLPPELLHEFNIAKGYHDFIMKSVTSGQYTREEADEKIKSGPASKFKFYDRIAGWMDDHQREMSMLNKININLEKLINIMERK